MPPRNADTECHDCGAPVATGSHAQKCFDNAAATPRCTVCRHEIQAGAVAGTWVHQDGWGDLGDDGDGDEYRDGDELDANHPAQYDGSESGG